MNGPLAPDLLRKMHAYWRAANYLAVGQIYLFDNPLLKEPLQLKHIKPRLLSHWGPTEITGWTRDQAAPVAKERTSTEADNA